MLGSRLPSGCDSLCLRVSASRGRVAPSASRHGGISLASFIREAATAEPYQLSSILDYSGLDGNVNMEKNLNGHPRGRGFPLRWPAPDGKRPVSSRGSRNASCEIYSALYREVRIGNKQPSIHLRAAGFDRASPRRGACGYNIPKFLGAGVRPEVGRRVLGTGEGERKSWRMWSSLIAAHSLRS
ncbi:hypothetical protein FF3_00379 [Fretibacterium fastidiosum]